MKLIKKTKKVDNYADTLLDNLTTLSDVDWAIKTLDNLSEYELELLENVVQKCKKNADRLLKAIKNKKG